MWQRRLTVCGYPGWYVPLLFAFKEYRFSRNVSYNYDDKVLCLLLWYENKIILRKCGLFFGAPIWNRVCCIRFQLKTGGIWDSTWDFLFGFILYVPVNSFSVMPGWIFLGWTSTKQGIKCLAQGHSLVTPVKLESAIPGSRVKLSTIEPPRSMRFWYLLH